MSLKHECYAIITNFVRYNNGIVLRILKNVLINETPVEAFIIIYFKILQPIKKLRS